MEAQKSAWYMSALLFNSYLFTKVTTSHSLKSLLHDVGKILDKPILNQVKALDAVISFRCSYEVWMFASLFYLKQKNNEKSYQLVFKSACNWPFNHFNHSLDGRNCFLLGGYFEICICKSDRKS